MKYIPLVSISCITYNHELYISQAIEGFLMQKTTFPFEIVILDDASTDKTATIINEYVARYPDLIFPILQSENQYSKGVRCLSARFSFPKARGKYIALCEGDDFWTDPYKLQKQVDFMETHPEFGLVYTEIDCLHESSGVLEKSAFRTRLGIHPNTFEDFLINAWFLAPCTWVFRRSLITELSNNLINGPLDIQLLLWISANSCVGFISDSTSTYRILEVSMSHIKSVHGRYLFRKRVLEIQLTYAEKYFQSLTDEILLIFGREYFRQICRYENKDYVEQIVRIKSKYNQYSLKERFLFQAKKLGMAF